MEVGVMKCTLRCLEQLPAEVDQSEVVSYIHALLDENEPTDDTSETGNGCGCQKWHHNKLKAKLNNDPGHEAGMGSLPCSISNSQLLAAYQLQPNELMLIARICQKIKANSDQNYNGLETVKCCQEWIIINIGFKSETKTGLFWACTALVAAHGISCEV